MNCNRFLEFTKDEKGQLAIAPKETTVAKRIIRYYLEDASFVVIRRELETDGLLIEIGRKLWRQETVHKMPDNKKYINDVLIQKTYAVII